MLTSLSLVGIDGYKEGYTERRAPLGPCGTNMALAILTDDRCACLFSDVGVEAAASAAAGRGRARHAPTPEAASAVLPCWRSPLPTSMHFCLPQGIQTMWSDMRTCKVKRLFEWERRLLAELGEELSGAAAHWSPWRAPQQKENREAGVPALMAAMRLYVAKGHRAVGRLGAGAAALSAQDALGASVFLALHMPVRGGSDPCQCAMRGWTPVASKSTPRAAAATAWPPVPSTPRQVRHSHVGTHSPNPSPFARPAVGNRRAAQGGPLQHRQPLLQEGGAGAGRQERDAGAARK